MPVTRQCYDESMRARDRAGKALKPGDRIRVSRCGGIVATYTFAGWEGYWAVSKSGIADLSPASILKVNGVPTTFRDTIDIGGKTYRRFIRYQHEDVDDGTLRCIRCGQIDDEPWHDSEICKGALEMHVPEPRPTATRWRF